MSPRSKVFARKAETKLPVELRPALPENYALCLELLRSADEDDIRIRAAMTDPTNTTYIAYDGPTVIGAVVIHWHNPDAEIIYIAVIDNMRGQGFGKKIIAALIAQARLRNVLAVVVGTANSSIDNIAFYQKCGFRLDHVRCDYFNYVSQPVIEDGILMRDMLVFRLALG